MIRDALPTVGSGRRKKERPAGDSKKGHKLNGDRIECDQCADGRERPYKGTGKPHSIDADSWRQMSTRLREIHVQAERESLTKERRREHPERNPAAPAPGRKLLIEFACKPDSRLSAVMMECGGEAVRVRIGSFDIMKAKGGRVACEWPRHCLGWKQPFMQKCLADCQHR